MQKYYTVGTAGYQMAVSMAYDDLDRITRYAEGSFATAYDYLSMGMLGSSTTSYGSLQVTGSYAYDIASDEALTGRVSGFTSTVKYGSTTKSNTTYTYTYDAAGNITHIYLGGVLKYSYEYDNLNQLIRENNAVAGETYVFTYDDAGNILTKKTYAYTTGTLGTVQDTDTYTYGNSINGDRLMRYNNVSCVIDALGNPLRYANGTNYIMTWTKGRQLAKTVNGGVTTTYTYNADGIRTSKTVGGVTTVYALDGTTILAEQKDGVVIRYFYDANGSPVGFMYNGTRYHYEKNLQGDIVAILNYAGTALVTYAYDAWGNIVSETYSASYEYLANANPFRYRGYYYDVETGFYYLQSRYYDPVTGRFINADSYINANGDLVGYNMYAYCSNNPVMYVDPSGEATFSIGVNFSAFFVTGVSYTYSISFDTHGNIAIHKTRADPFRSKSGVIFGTPSFSVSVVASFTTCESVKDLEGVFYNVGSSITTKFGAEVNFKQDGELVGFTVSRGLSKGIPFYVSATQTEPIHETSLEEVLDSLLDSLLHLITGDNICCKRTRLKRL